MAPSFEHFEHQADMGVRGFGRTCEEAFEQAALALTAVVVPPELIAARETVSVHCSAGDIDLLLLDWLSAVVYQNSPPVAGTHARPDALEHRTG
jgi:SHS2 domain-containing protein